MGHHRAWTTRRHGLRWRTMHGLPRWVAFSNLLGQVTGPVWRVENLVVEDREVQCQSQSNRVSWLHLGSCYFERFLVRPLRVVHYAFVSFGRHNISLSVMQSMSTRQSLQAVGKCVSQYSQFPHQTRRNQMKKDNKKKKKKKKTLV